MTHEYTLIHPDIDQGQGATRQLINELVDSWKQGTHGGADEIASVVSFLSHDERLPAHTFRLLEDGPVLQLAWAALSWLQENRPTASPLLKRFCERLGTAEIPLSVIGVASATSAITAALDVMGVGGGEVITASFNYVGVGNAIMRAGAKPRFVDIDPATWCMDPEAVRAAITPATRAIILTHVNRFADLMPYLELVEAHRGQFSLIQDASLAIASTHDGLKPGIVNVGPQGVTVFSLTVSKIVTGLGGALVSANNAGMLSQIMSIAHQGIDLANPSRLATCGMNAKLGALQATIALASLKRREKLIARRRELKARYDEALAPLAAKGLVTLQDVGAETCVTHYGLLVPDHLKLARTMYDRHRIQLGVWHLLHRQDLYRRMFPESCGTLPISETMENRASFLPFHTRLSDDDVQTIAAALEAELEV